MRIVATLSLALVVITPLFAQNFRLGDRVVSRSEYEAALPHVGADDIVLRNLPGLAHSEAVATLASGTRVNLQVVTSDRSVIDGESHLWFRVQARDDYRHSGLVNGEYIEFQNEFPLEFWLEQTPVRQFPFSRFMRHGLGKQLVRGLLGIEGTSVSRDQFSHLVPVHTVESPIWYHEGREFMTYLSTFGRITLLGNDKEQEWLVSHITITRDVGVGMVRVGSTLDQVVAQLGEDNSMDNGLLSYYFDWIDDGPYAVELRINNGRVTEILLVYMFT